MTKSRYSASGPEAEFEPGSRGRVLRNLLGITRVRELHDAQTEALRVAMDGFVRRLDGDHRYRASDIRAMHRAWLGGIFEWAGEYRSVNMMKDGFPFAAAGRIPSLMSDLEKDALAKCTPCDAGDVSAIAGKLARVHVELVLIHPFRDGNGRVARMLAALMAFQAGIPLLDFSEIVGGSRLRYFAAVQAGLDRNYSPMQSIFERLIERAASAP